MDHDFGRLKWTYLTKLTIAGMIVPKSASVVGPFPPATNGSLVLDASWPSVIGHRQSCRPMTNADFGTIISANDLLVARDGLNVQMNTDYERLFHAITFGAETPMSCVSKRRTNTNYERSLKLQHIR